MADKSMTSVNPFLALFPSTNAAQNFIKQTKEQNVKSEPENDKWMANEIIESIFCFTLNKGQSSFYVSSCIFFIFVSLPCSLYSFLLTDRKNLPWKTPGCVVYMSDSNHGANNKQLGSREVLSQVLFDRIMLTEIIFDDIIESDCCPKNLRISATETKVIPYLYQCFIRCIKYKAEHLVSIYCNLSSVHNL